jgi:hypothetical protein
VTVTWFWSFLVRTSSKFQPYSMCCYISPIQDNHISLQQNRVLAPSFAGKI